MAQAKRAARTKLEPVKVTKDEHGEPGHDTGEAAKQLSSKMEEVGLAGRKGAGALAGTDNVPALQGHVAQIQAFAIQDANVTFNATVARADILRNFITEFYETDEERFGKSCNLYMSSLREALRKRYAIPDSWLTKEGKKLLTKDQAKILHNINVQAGFSGTILDAAKRNHSEVRKILEGSGTFARKLEQARQLIPQRKGARGRPRKTDDDKVQELLKSLVENVGKLSDDQMLVFISNLAPNLADRPLFEKIGKFLHNQVLNLRKLSAQADAASPLGNGKKTGTHG